MYDDVTTRNDDNELAVRTVSSSGDNGVNPNDVFTRDDEGRLSLRTVGGSGGGGSVDKNKIINKSETLPTPSASNLGQAYMYDGESNALYTHGYIYQVVAEQTATDVEFSGNIITSWAVADFVRYMQEGGASYNEVVRGTLTYDESGGLWDLIGYDENGIEVLKFHEYTEDLVDFGCIFASETHQDGDTCSFSLTTTASGYKWKRLDVQPAGGSGSDVSSVNGKTGAVILDAKDVNAIPQYTTMPTASASNVGEIAMYSGETTSDVPASAVATQTVGSGLSGLSVNVDTFIGVEQPSGAETVAFTANVIPSDMTFTSVPEGVTITVTNADSFINWIRSNDRDPNDYTNALLHDNGAGFWSVALDSSMSGIITGMDAADWANYGIVITGSPIDNYDAYYELTIGQTTWEKDSETVDISAYGISYIGTPADGDTISVAYTPVVAGITNGYFYKSSVEYSDPTATISQTVGSGLSDLAVNVETFIEAEQPTQSENVAFVASVIADDMSLGTQVGTFVCGLNSAEFLARLVESWGNEWWNVTGTKNPYFVYTNDGWALSSQDGPTTISDPSSSVKSYGVANTDWGFYVTDDSMVQVGDYVSVIYTEGGTSWSKNGTTVDLAEYGISYSGTPVDGDTLTVAYTAPAPIGYKWNRTDVQPTSGSGGGSGIEWKTKVDLPAEYAGDQYNAAPYYTIVGGLPDGEYEFYFSTKLLSNDSSQPVMIGEVLYKMKLRINNENSSFSGVFGYVFNGDYSGSSNMTLGYGRTWWVYVYKNDDDLILYQTERPFTSDALAYNGGQAVPECFKLSAVKNVETGQEYIAVGSINLDGSMPSYTVAFNGNMKINRLVDEPAMPNPTATRAMDINSMDTQTFHFPIQSQFGVFNMKHAESNSEFVVVWTGQYGGSYGIVPYSQQIIKATGAFANCHLEKDNSYIYVMGVDTAAVALLTGSVEATLGGIMSGSESVWVIDLPQNTTMIQQVGPQGYKLGTITADCIGNIVQYTGATDANYTNGYWYKANGTVITNPESIVLTSQDPEFSISVNSVSNLKSAIQNLTGWGDSYIEEQFANGFQWVFDISFDSGESSTVNYANFGFWSSSDPSILSCFTVTYTGLDQGTREVYCSESYTPESKVVQNPSWDRVNVQPLDLTGVSGYDATKTQVLKNVQGVLTWVDE